MPSLQIIEDYLLARKIMTNEEYKKEDALITDILLHNYNRQNYSGSAVKVAELDLVSPLALTASARSVMSTVSLTMGTV